MMFVSLANFSLGFIDLNSHWCSIYDGAHFTTFDQQNFDFKYSGSNFISFTDYNQIRVTNSFKPCNKGPPEPTCNCGIHVSLGDSVFFLDNCGIKSSPILQQFYFYDGKTPFIVKCDMSLIPLGLETDDLWWNAPGNPIITPNNKFSCAKSVQKNTFIIRTNSPDNDYNIYIKLVLHDSGISFVNIRPSVYSYSNSGGLCGLYNNDPNDDLFIWIQDRSSTKFNGKTNNGYKMINADPFSMSNFWILDRMAPIELAYKKLLKHDCPCDQNKVSNNVPRNQCSSLVSRCLALSNGLTVIFQDYIHSQEETKTDKIEATSRCRKFFEIGKIPEAVEKNLVSQEKFDLLLKLCLADMSATGDNLWAINKVQIAQNWALETCSKTQNLCDELAQRPTKCSQLDYLVY